MCNISGYNYLIKLDKATFDMLMDKEILRINIRRDLAIYQHYMDQCKYFTKMQAATNAAEKFKLSEESIHKIIRRMK